MIAEWLATGRGLGNLLNQSRGYLDYGMIWSVALVSVLVSVALYQVGGGAGAGGDAAVAHHAGEDPRHHGGDRLAELPLHRLVEMDAVDRTRGDDRAGVEEGNAAVGSRRACIRCRVVVISPFRRRTSPEPGELDQRRGGNEQHLRGRLAGLVGRGLDHVDQHAGAVGDVVGRHREAHLQVVGAELDDEEVDRGVGLEHHRQEARAVLVDAVDGIVMDGGATVEAFLDHRVRRARASRGARRASGRPARSAPFPARLGMGTAPQVLESP